jgi:hypothetical protein
MIAMKTVDRHFCSHLVRLRLSSQAAGEERELTANIEEIASTEVCLNLEEPLAAGLSLQMAASDGGETHYFSGTVVDCEEEPPAGFYVRVEFDPGCRWSAEVFEPRHMIRADSVRSARTNATPANPACCDRGICPRAIVSRILEPEFTLTDRVRAVAREVATLCGDLTEAESAACFGSLFGAGPECGLYSHFTEAHAEERRRGPSQRRRDLRGQLESVVQLAGALPVGATGLDGGGSQAPWVTPLIE